MEEQVGELWHRLITRLADSYHPEAAVRLAEVERQVALLFRALGGDGALQVTAAEATVHGARRSWLQRVAGVHEKVTLAWRDAQYLRLPAVIDWFPDRALNRELYLWLAALAAVADEDAGDWFVGNQRRVVQVLGRYPGLRTRYQRLVEAHLLLRPDAERLSVDQAAAERAVCQALREPGSVADLPAARRPPQPVPLWLHPQPPRPLPDAAAGDDPGDSGTGDRECQQEVEQLRRRAERVEEPEADRGLITVRMENIFTWGEYVRVDRGSEDEDDLDRAEAIARDLDRLVVARSDKRPTATLRFDLDLPAEAQDDRILHQGLLLPEWDWKRHALLPDRCRIVPMLAADAQPLPLPLHLCQTAKRLRAQFQLLAPARTWHRARSDGQDIDLDAYLRFASDQAAGLAVSGEGLYREMCSGARDLVSLLMADLSLSTDTWIDDDNRVIDVIRDSLFLFAESLAVTGDRFGLCGFSSRKRDPVRVHLIKAFEEPYDARIRGRIAAIRPGYYTRMGAAIRFGSRILGEQSAGCRLLLLLTDGKPNDLDQYEGRFGFEDTRQAILEARRVGLEPFCVTIDERGNDYLPYLFGTGGYVVIHHPSELPKRLPLLYARLAGH